MANTERNYIGTSEWISEALRASALGAQGLEDFLGGLTNGTRH